MSERGHSWLQTTVSAIESGERSLKLTEAVDLAEVLDTPLEAVASESSLFTTERELRRSIDILWKSYESAIQALKDFNKTRGAVFLDAARRLTTPQPQEVSDDTLTSFADMYTSCNIAAVVFNAFDNDYGDADLYTPNAPRQTEQWEESKAREIAKLTGVNVDTSAAFPTYHDIKETRDLLSGVIRAHDYATQKNNSDPTP